MNLAHLCRIWSAAFGFNAALATTFRNGSNDSVHLTGDAHDGLNVPSTRLVAMDEWRMLELSASRGYWVIREVDEVRTVSEVITYLPQQMQIAPGGLRHKAEQQTQVDSS